MASYKDRLRNEREAEQEARRIREERKKSKVAYLKVTKDEKTASDTIVRILPYSHVEDGYPFFKVVRCEKLAGAIGEKYGPIEPYATYGDETVLSEFIGEIKAKDYELYKEFRPTENHYVWVIERGAEHEGPKLWQLSFSQRSEIEHYMLSDENWSDDDIIDPVNGFDVVITTKVDTRKPARPYEGKMYPAYETKISPSRKRKGPIFTTGRTNEPDSQAIETLLENLPTWESVFRKPDAEYLEKFVNKVRAEVLGEGTTKGGDDSEAPKGATKTRVASGTQSAPAAQSKSATKPSRKAPEPVEDDSDEDLANEFDNILNSAGK